MSLSTYRFLNELAQLRKLGTLTTFADPGTKYQHVFLLSAQNLELSYLQKYDIYNRSFGYRISIRATKGMKSFFLPQWRTISGREFSEAELRRIMAG